MPPKDSFDNHFVFVIFVLEIAEKEMEDIREIELWMKDGEKRRNIVWMKKFNIIKELTEIEMTELYFLEFMSFLVWLT